MKSVAANFINFAKGGRVSSQVRAERERLLLGLRLRSAAASYGRASRLTCDP